MGVTNKISGVARNNIDKVSGAAKDNVYKVSGVQFVVASRWIVGGQYKLFTPNTPADPTSTWASLVQLFPDGGSDPVVGIRDVAYGKDGSGNKLWVIGIDENTSELAYCEDSAAALGRPFDDVSTPRWNDVGNVATDLYAVYGGPAIAWGNDVWVAGGNDNQTSSPNRRSLKRSTTGTSGWAAISSVPQDRNQPSRGVCYHEGNNWFALHDSDVWKSTDNGASWTRALEDAGGVTGWFNCMAYDGSGTWVAAGNAGRIAYSTDDWATATEVAVDDRAFSNQVLGIVYCAGIGKWIIVATGGLVGYASDATGAWTNAKGYDPGDGDPIPIMTPARALHGIATDNTTIVTVGIGGNIWVSTDGINWTSEGNAGLGDLYSVACDVIGAGMRQV